MIIKRCDRCSIEVKKNESLYNFCLNHAQISCSKIYEECDNRDLCTECYKSEEKFKEQIVFENVQKFMLWFQQKENLK